jgi:hypothetical protein
VPWEDKDGTSALKIAILSDAPIQVVRLLQYVTHSQTEKQQEQDVLSRKRIRQVTQDSLDHQQPYHPVSEPSQQEPNSLLDLAASTTTLMPARNK